MTDVDRIALARRALALLDLTELGDTCREDQVELMLGKAHGPAGDVAAICVWPNFVSMCRKRLAGKGIRIATVINFPKGGDDIERAIQDAEGAIDDGAHEIDLVLPWRAFLAGEDATCRAMIGEVKDTIPEEALLKVILETGELKDAAVIRRAADLAIEAGADFIKTSTGKTAVSATPEAVAVMLEAIRAAGRPIGLKPSGGIRTLEDAGRYLAQVDAAMGPDWATPKTFRFGASGLHAALAEVILGTGGPTDAAPASY
jgi:deoxyribose-phosphate aldolase